MFLVPMLKETKWLSQRLAVLLIDGATGHIGNQSCLTKILIAIVHAAELRPLPNQDVHADGIASHLIL